MSKEKSEMKIEDLDGPEWLDAIFGPEEDDGTCQCWADAFLSLAFQRGAARLRGEAVGPPVHVTLDGDGRLCDKCGKPTTVDWSEQRG